MVDRTVAFAGPEAPPVRQLLGTLAGRRWLVAGPAIVAVMLAVAWLQATPPEFRASMVVGPGERPGWSPTHDRPAPSDAGAGAGAFDRYLALLTSTETARRLAAEDWVLPAVFPEAWDVAAERWHPPPSLGSRLARAANRALGRAGWHPPGPEALADRLRGRLAVEPVGGSDMRRIGLRHPDRSVAARLLARLHAAADGLIREAAARRADAQIAYIAERLSRAERVEHRRALELLLTEQERRRMLIQADLPFAAVPVEPPSAPPLPGWPDPWLVLCLAAASGLFAGLTLAFAADGLRAAEER